MDYYQYIAQRHIFLLESVRGPFTLDMVEPHFALIHTKIDLNVNLLTAQVTLTSRKIKGNFLRIFLFLFSFRLLSSTSWDSNFPFPRNCVLSKLSSMYVTFFLFLFKNKKTFHILIWPFIHRISNTKGFFHSAVEWKTE